SLMAGPHAEGGVMTARTAVAAAAEAPRAPAGRFRRLLYLCEYPPSTLAGAPIIAKQLLRYYDQESLHVLCCRGVAGRVEPLVRDSYLPCAHTTVPSWKLEVRPHLLTGPLFDSLNCLRVPRILAAARALVRREGIEALFTIPWRAEFALAAYRLHRET